jgi:hypothetical protein
MLNSAQYLNDVVSCKRTELFDDHLDEKFVCSICREVLNRPLQCKDDHAFCKECIYSWLEHNNTCPVCREQLTPDMLSVNRSIEAMIARTRVRCIYSQQGPKTSPSSHEKKKTKTNMSNCQWVGVYKDIFSHLQNDCIYHPLDCPNGEYGCTEKIAKCDLDSHLIGCPAMCSYCSSSGAVRGMDKHKESCAMVKVQCHCKEMVFRKDLKEHKRNCRSAADENSGTSSPSDVSQSSESDDSAQKSSGNSEQSDETEDYLLTNAPTPEQMIATTAANAQASTQNATEQPKNFLCQATCNVDWCFDKESFGLFKWDPVHQSSAFRLAALNFLEFFFVADGSDDFLTIAIGRSDLEECHVDIGGTSITFCGVTQVFPTNTIIDHFGVSLDKFKNVEEIDALLEDGAKLRMIAKVNISLIDSDAGLTATGR